MAFGLSLVIVAAGAVMRYAYSPTNSSSFHWGTAGLILMIIGIVGAVSSAGVYAARGYRRSHTTAVTEGPGGRIVRRDDVDSTSSNLGG